MSDRRPARVRVYSDKNPGTAPGEAGGVDIYAEARAEAAAAHAPTPAPGTPQRRRTDPGYAGAAGGSSLGFGLLMILFILGTAIGGALSVALNLVEMPVR